MSKSHDQKAHEKWKKIAEEAELEAEMSELDEEQDEEEPTLQEAPVSVDVSPSKEDEFREKVARLQADFENQRRRLERDLSNAHRYALDKFADALLPVVDSLERGMQAKAETTAGVTQAHDEGLQLTHKLFLDVLKKFGIQAVDPMGLPFDPHHHEAVSVQPNAEHPANTVVAVLQKGYLLHDRLIRPALVVVAK